MAPQLRRGRWSAARQHGLRAEEDGFADEWFEGATLVATQRTADAIQQKLDRVDEAFLFQRSIDIETYDRHAERLREELTLARIAKLLARDSPCGGWVGGPDRRQLEPHRGVAAPN
jgi:hypothetical protein